MKTFSLFVALTFSPAIHGWCGPHKVTMGLVGSVSKSARRVRDSLLNKERSREDLKIGIAGFYDRSSKLWEDVWGEHMHHGYYIPEDRTDHQQAQIDLIDQVLAWAGANSAQTMLDVGCGIGGSSRHIARKFGCKAQGVTLSPYQAGRANELAKEQGLEGQAKFQVADALDMPFDDNSFDLVWSLESGEHMPDKKQFINELFRVATPGGRIIIVTWVHRDLKEGETGLTKKEGRLLDAINRAYYLPKWCSSEDYIMLLKEKGATGIKSEDWSYIIAPFWKAVIRSSLNLRSVWGLLKSGFSTQRGAYAMFLMLKGFNMGLIKFGLLSCTKPDSTSESI
jgi:tocopherol O-methyltransferase